MWFWILWLLFCFVCAWLFCKPHRVLLVAFMSIALTPFIAIPLFGRY